MTTTTVFQDNDHEQPVRGLFHWLDLPGVEVMYELYTDEDGTEVMAPLYWRVDESVEIPEVIA